MFLDKLVRTKTIFQLEPWLNSMIKINFGGGSYN